MKRPQFKTFFLRYFSQALRDQSGFSLAEVLVAAGMLGVLSLGVTQLMQNSTKTEKRLGQQMNLVTMEGQIREALRDPIGCGRTLNAQVVRTDGNINAANDMSVGWSPLPDNIIYRANNQSFLDADKAARWGIVAQQWVDAAQLTGVYGDGSNRVTVLEMRYRGFWNSVGTDYNNDANYENPGTDGNGISNITGTAPTEAIGTIIVRVTFTRGNYGRFDGMTPAEQQRLSSSLTAGPFRVVRYFPLRVRVLSAEPQRLVRCLTNNDDVLSQYCSSLGGYMDETDGRCKNIKISDTAAAVGAPPGSAPDQDNNWAIAAQTFPADEAGGSVIAETSMAVGYDDRVTPAVADAFNYVNSVAYDGTGDATGITQGIFGPEVSVRGPINTIGTRQSDGSIRAGNNLADQGGYLMVEKDAWVDRDVFANRSLNVGLPDARSAANLGDATIGRDLQVNRSANLGIVADEAVTPYEATRGGLLMTGSLNVGQPTATERSTNAGDATFMGDVQANSGMNIGLATSFTTREINDGRLLVRERITVGQDAPNTDNRTFKVGSGSSSFLNGSREVRINSEGLVSFWDSGTERTRIRNDGEISFFNDAGAEVLEVGVGPGDYRPIRIHNQTFDYNFANGSNEAKEVPTKEWVRRMVFGGLENNDALKAAVIGNITNYAQHHTLDQIRQFVCNRTRLRTAAQISQCAWDGTYCSCPNSNCSQSGTAAVGQAVCSAITSTSSIVATTFMRASRFYTSGQPDPGAGWVRATNIRASSNMYAQSIYLSANVDATGTVLGRSLVRSLGEVRAGTFVRSMGRVCAQGGTSNYYCYTKFGKYMCNNRGFMIGIAYGHPICARSGGGSTAPVRY